jgi:hypothetical protein
MLKPAIVNVTEQRILGPNNQPQKVLVVTYKVGTYGPFTLNTTQADLLNGNAQNAMQLFANTLAGLPTADTAQ